MTTVLIVDACKPSLVMTSGLKTKCRHNRCASGKETIEYLSENTPDLCVIDFDLPDVDGPALVEAMRRFSPGRTNDCLSDAMVEKAVTDHLFAASAVLGFRSHQLR